MSLSRFAIALCGVALMSQSLPEPIIWAAYSDPASRRTDAGVIDYALGQKYEAERDYRMAKIAYAKAGRTGYGKAYSAIARLYENGYLGDTPGLNDVSQRMYERAAQLGDADAAVHIAEYAQLLNVPKEYDPERTAKIAGTIGAMPARTAAEIARIPPNPKIIVVPTPDELKLPSASEKALRSPRRHVPVVLRLDLERTSRALLDPSAIFVGVLGALTIEPASASYQIRSTRGGDVVRLDPATGIVTALRPGHVLIDVSYSGLNKFVCVVVQETRNQADWDRSNCSDLLANGESDHTVR